MFFVVLCSIGLFNSPGMQSMMQQMLANPQLMQSSMMAPSVQAIASNPELARQVKVDKRCITISFEKPTLGHN